MTLMPEFRQQLLTAAASRSGERERRRGSVGARSLGLTRLLSRLSAPIAGTVSILVVLAVVALALTLGSAHHGAGTTGGHGAGPIPSHGADSAQLLGELGVLRGGHASTLPAGDPLPIPGLRIDRSLVRTVHSSGYTVTLVPVSRAGHGTAASGRPTELVVTVQGPHVPSGFPAIGTGTIAVGVPVSAAAIARHGTIIIMYVRNALNRAVVVVPDGVTRVGLAQFEPARSSSRRVAAIAPASAPVHDNVAVISLPNVTTTTLHQTPRTVRDHGGLFSSRRCRATAALYFVPVTARTTLQRTTAGGTRSEAVTVQTSLNAYSTTILPAVSCHGRPAR